MELHKSAEDYLEAILILSKQKGVVRSVDVANHMEFSKPSVSRAVGNLKADGYLDMHPDGELVLTEKGRAAAETVYERHTVISGLLTALGVGSAVAAQDACLIEHVVSEETFARLKAIYGDGEALQKMGSAAQDRKSDKDKDKKKKKKKK